MIDKENGLEMLCFTVLLPNTISKALLNIS